MGTKQITNTLIAKSSSTLSQSFSILDNSHLSNKDQYQIDKIYQQNIITIPDNISYQEQMHIYWLRKQQELNLVKIYSVERLTQKISNLSSYQLKVLSQKIVITLDQVQNFTFQMGLSILYSASIGFQCLYKYLGYFEINDYFVGLNVNKQLRVWMNKEWGKNEKMHQYKRQPFGDIEDIMVQRLIFIVQNHLKGGQNLTKFEIFKNKFDFWTFTLLKNFIIQLAFEQKIRLLKTINLQIKQQAKSLNHIFNFKERKKCPTIQNLNKSIGNINTSLRNYNSINLLNSTKIKSGVQNPKYIFKKNNISPTNRTYKIKSTFSKSKEGIRMLGSVSFTNNAQFVKNNNNTLKKFRSKRQSQDLFNYPKNSYQNDKRISVNEITRKIKSLVTQTDQKINLKSFDNNKQNQNPSLQNIRKELRQFLGNCADEDLTMNYHHQRNKTVVQQNEKLSKVLKFQNKQNQRKRNKQLNHTQQIQYSSSINFKKKQNTKLLKIHQTIQPSNQKQYYLGLQSYCPSTSSLSPLSKNYLKQHKIQQILKQTVTNIKTIDQSICAKTASRDGKSNITLLSKAKQLKQSFIITKDLNNNKCQHQQGSVRLNSLKARNTLTQSINIPSSKDLQSEPRQSANKKPLSMLDLMIIKRNLIKEKRNEQQLDISVSVYEDSDRKSKNKIIEQDD